jgi:hypothetical protein
LARLDVSSSDDLGTQLSFAYYSCSCRFDINDAGLHLSLRDYRLPPHPKSHNSFHTSHHITFNCTRLQHTPGLKPIIQPLSFISTHHATTDPFADADFGSPASSATAGAKANASRTSTPKIDDDLGGVAGGKIHIRKSELLLDLAFLVCLLGVREVEAEADGTCLVFVVYLDGGWM